MQDANTSITYEVVQTYIDILPQSFSYFNATFAHRDTAQPNIFTFNFRTADTAIPSYGDSTTAGRLYIGFPTVDANNGGVFLSNLGYSTGDGSVIPCWFKTGPTYIAPISGKSLSCFLRISPFNPNNAFV